MPLTEAEPQLYRRRRNAPASIRKNLIHVGAFGQAKSRRIVNAAVIFCLGLANCSGVNTARYAGSLTVEQGDCGPAFTQAGQNTATLMLRGKDVEFAPTNGVVVLRGRTTDTGHLVALNNTIGADHKPFSEGFEGDLTSSRVVGKFGNPRCRATVDLTRR